MVARSIGLPVLRWHCRAAVNAPVRLTNAAPAMMQELIKQLITSLMLSAPPLVRAQLSEALSLISSHEFPAKWPVRHLQALLGGNVCQRGLQSCQAAACHKSAHHLLGYVRRAGCWDCIATACNVLRCTAIR